MLMKTGLLVLILSILLGTALAENVPGEWIVHEEYVLQAGELDCLSEKKLREMAPQGKTVWTSSNSNVVSVDKWGNVLAKKLQEPGEAYVSAARSGVTYTWRVRVVPLAQEILLYANGQPLADGRVLNLDAGENSVQLSAQVLPEGASQAVEFIAWGAKIDQSGLLTVEEPGVIKISVRASDGSKAKKECEIAAAHLVQSIAVTGPDSVVSGDEIALEAQILPRNATVAKIAWESSDPQIAQVDKKGVVQAQMVEENARVAIVARAQDGSGVSVEKQITVLPAAQKVEILFNGEKWPNNSLILDESAIGSSMIFGANVFPQAVSQQVSWHSSDEKVARFADGKLEIVAAGECKIAAVSADGKAAKEMYVVVAKMEKLPYYIEVDEGNQVVRVYERNADGFYTKLHRRMVCSTGKGFLEKRMYRMHTARKQWITTIIDGVMCQYGTRFREHIWFHSLPYAGYHPDRMDMQAYSELGTNASHGCIRILAADAKWIHDEALAGTPVLVCKNERAESEYGAVSWPDAKDGWDPTDPNPDNPYYDPTYTSVVSQGD